MAASESFSHNQRQRAFKRCTLQTWSDSTPPALHSVCDPIHEQSAIGALASLQRSRDADKFNFQFMSPGFHNRIAMTTDVHERKMRRDFRVSHSQRLSHVACLLQG